MTTAFRRSALVALLLLSSSLFAQQKPWDVAAFTAEPNVLLTSAAQVQAGEFPLVMLLDEALYDIDADGRTRSKERVMLYVVAEAGVEYAGEVRAPWAPWYGERPSIEARVITKDGTVHTLDQAAVVEVPAPEQNDIYSDGRVLRAPLPAVAIGSVVEYVITRVSTNPIPGAGVAVHYHFGGYLPCERTRVTLDAPAFAQPRFVNKTGVEPRIEETGDRKRMTFEAGRIEGERELERYVPYDVAPFRYLSFSTGSSWQEIASRYSEIVDKQIADAGLQKMVRNAIGKSTDRKEIVTKLLAAIQKDIRYAGVEVGEGSIIPRTPKQVLANKYGDCKDKASMLVAMLREAGVTAHVALLNAGEDFDVLPDLPGLGIFNHAIVVVEGDPAIWVDPTDVFARAGELPLLDQGRMALIAKPETTTLVRTPEAPSTANVYRELRTFVLPEDGKPSVVEVTEPTTVDEASLRRWISTLDSKALRENLEEYARSAYRTKSLAKFDVTEPNDLTRQFRLTLEVPESDSGITREGEAAVVINIAGLPRQVPDALRDWREPQPGDDPEDAPKARTNDFLFPQPGVREWTYRVVPPTGYMPRTLPPTETKQIGTMTFSQELHAEPDHTVVAKFRFDSGKRRLTPAEFQESRVAFTKFVTDNTVTIGFDQIGKSKLNAGDVRGALDEYRRLTALHPKEAQHHIETARTLLAGGLGDAAREEIRKAVAIEPKNARAHENLGYILLHDSLGRHYRKGFDLAGAIAAYRKAKELDADDYSIRVSLASALTYGEDGTRFGPGAHLSEAVDEYKALAADLGDDGKAMEPELTLVYSHMGRFADVRALAPTLVNEQQRDLASLIATAAIDGSDAALRELGAFDQQRRRYYASGIAQTLMQLRLYPQSAALLEAASQGASTAESRQSIEMIRKLKRTEDIPVDAGPRGILSKFFHALLHSDEKTVRELLPPEYVEDKDDVMQGSDFRPPDGMSAAVFTDMMASMLEIQQDGDDETGYRLRLRAFGGSSADEFTVFVRREKDRWMMRGMSVQLEMLGDTTLNIADEGNVEAARKWLNWTREEVKGGSGDDALDGSPLAAVWPKSKAAATLDEVRLGAALIASAEHNGKKSEPILVAAREKAESEAAKSAIDIALANIYEEQKDWPKMLAATQRLFASNPDSPTAFHRYIDALHGSGKLDEATAAANARLEKMPNDRDALESLAKTASRKGDYSIAQDLATKVVEELRPTMSDYHTAAWIALFTGNRLERAIEHAQHASKESGDKKVAASSMKTLAALYAETGKNAEARDAFLRSLDANNATKLESNDWYILARIAENYGVNDFAIASYRKVDKERSAATAGVLAQRRLDGLTKKP